MPENFDFSNPNLWKSSKSKRKHENTSSLLSPNGIRKGSDPPPLTSPSSSSSVIGVSGGVLSGTSLLQAFLDQESPQLNPSITDFLLDGGLSMFLDVITRPIGSTHAVSSLGQDALAAVAAKTVERVSLASSIAVTDDDVKSSSSNVNNSGSIISGGGGGREGRSVSSSSSSSSSFSKVADVDFSVYGVSSFAVHEAALGSGAARASSSLLIPTLSFSPPPLSSSSTSSDVNSFSTLLPHDEDEDGEPMLDTAEEMSASLRSGFGIGGGGGGGIASEIVEMSRSVIQAHAATFSAAVADLVNVKDVFHTRQQPHQQQQQQQHLDTSGQSSSDIGEPHSSSPATLSSPSSSSSSPSSRTSSSSTNNNRVRAFSLLSPRNSEEVEALKALANMMLAVEEGEDRAKKDDHDDSKAASSLSSLSIDDVGDDSNRKAHNSSNHPSSGPFSLPSSSDLLQEEQIELACVKRSYKAMRILSTGSALIEEVISQRVDEIARAMLSVFSSRNKGSFTHACAVLQRLLQSKPEEMASFLSSDTQRHLGGMLNFLHHPPVADTLLQLVTVNHLSSASGGAGPNATLSGPTGGHNGGGGMGAGGGFGRSMVGGGLAFLSGLSGLGGGGGGVGDGKPSLTTYNAPLMIYGTRANSTSIPLPITRGHVMKSLGGWGFLSVLAAHVYRPEFAASSDHSEYAADVLIYLLHTWASEERADSLFQVLTSDPRVLKGLATAAMIPRPGVDFDPSLLLSSSSSFGGGEGGVFSISSSSSSSSSLMPARQRASMRVLNELATLSFKPLLPHMVDAAGAPLQIGVQPALVENRLYKHSSVVGETLVAMLPRLAATLGHLHRKLHPDVPVISQKKTTTGSGGGSGGAGGTGGGTGGVSSASSLVVNNASAEKKKKKKKKGKNKGGQASLVSNSSSTTALSKGSEGAEDDDDEDGDEGVGVGGGKVGGSPSLLSQNGEGTLSSAVVPVPVISLPPVAQIASSSMMRQQNDGGKCSPTLSKSPSTNSTTSNAHSSAHHQLRHSIPFGFYRLHAAQLLALALNESSVKVRPPLRGVPLLDSPDLDKLLASTARSTAAAAAAASHHHTEEMNGRIDGHTAESTTTSTSRTDTSRDLLLDVVEKEEEGVNDVHDDHKLKIASLVTSVQALNLQSSSSSSSTTTTRGSNHKGEIVASSTVAHHNDGITDVDAAGGEDDDDDGEDDDDQTYDEDDDDMSLSVSSSTSRRRGGGGNHAKKKNKKKKNSGKKHHHQQLHNQQGGGGSVKVVSKRGSDKSVDSTAVTPEKGGSSTLNSRSSASASSVSVSQASFAVLSSAVLLFPRRALEVLRKKSSESSSEDDKIRSSRNNANILVSPSSTITLTESAVIPVNQASKTGKQQQQQHTDSSSSTHVSPPFSSISVLEGVSASLAAQAISSFTQSAVLSSSSSLGGGGGGGGGSGPILLSPETGSPIAFDPLDLWACLCTWVTLYPNTNLYHVAFLEIVSSVLRNSSDEHAIKAQSFIFSGARLISLFIKHYKEHEPSPPSTLRSRFVSPAHKQQMVPFVPSIAGSSGGGGGSSDTSTAITSSTSSVLDARRGGRPSSLSTAHSSARGVILKTLDLVRQLTTAVDSNASTTLSSSSTDNNQNKNQHNNSSSTTLVTTSTSVDLTLHSTSNNHGQGFLKQFLRDHTLWVEFQEKLKADLAVNSRPLVQTAQQQQQQQQLRSNSAANLGGRSGGEGGGGLFGGGGGGGGVHRANSSDNANNSSPSLAQRAYGLFGLGSGGGGGGGGGSSSILSNNRQSLAAAAAARGLSTPSSNASNSSFLDQQNQNNSIGASSSSSDEASSSSTTTTTAAATLLSEHPGRAAMLANFAKKKLAMKNAMNNIKTPVVRDSEEEDGEGGGGGARRDGRDESPESPPLLFSSSSSPTITSSDLLDVD